MKIFIIILISLIFVGCVTIEGRHSYTPQKAANWKNLGNRIYQFECNGGKIDAGPIVLHSTVVQEQENSWLYLRIQAPKRIETCDSSFVTLENKTSGKRVSPISVQPNVFNNDQAASIYDCYYYFDIKEDKSSQYILRISDKVLGCMIDPIPYVYEEYTDWYPMQLM